MGDVTFIICNVIFFISLYATLLDKLWINETHSNYVFFNMIYIGFEYASLELMFYIMFDYGASIMLKHHQSPDNALAISFYQNKMLAACPKCIFSCTFYDCFL